MRTQARVIAIDGAYAEVICDRQAACASCHKMENGGDCSVCSLMSSTSSAIKTRVYNQAGAQVGDVVELESKTARMLGYAAMVFLLPLLLFFMGYVLADFLFDGEAMRYACGGILFVLAFIGIRLYSEVYLKKRTDVTAVSIISTVSHEATEQEK